MKKPAAPVRTVICLAVSLAAAAACGPVSNGRDAESTDAAQTSDASTDALAVDASADDTTATDDAAAVTSDPLPAFDAATTAHVNDLIAIGQMRGNRRNVFAKIGDSITESRAFLYACGSGALDLGEHADLFDTVLYFREVNVDPDFNSLERPSMSAAGGWTVLDALAGGDQSPAAQELALLRPQWALVMYGTNDLEHDPDPGSFRTHMNELLDLVEAQGVVPVVSTIPPRLDREDYAGRVPAYNAAIRDLAATRHVPLVDFWQALQSLPNNGLDTDGIHPTANMTDGFYDACNMTSSGLASGYDVRNWLSLTMLQRLTR